MSAISSASSGNQFTLLQQLQQQNATGQFGRAGFAAQRQADFGSALQSAGVDPSKVSGIEQQIQAAVQSVTQSGTSGTNQRSAIKSAVDSVLQQNGVDLTKFQQALKANHAKHGGGARKAGNDGDGDDKGTATSGAATSTNAPSLTDPTQSAQSSQSSLVSSSFANLLKSLANGTAQQSSFTDLPAGTLLDVAA